MRGRNTFNVACLLSGLAWGATVTFGLLEPQQRAYFGWGCLFAPAIGLAAGWFSPWVRRSGPMLGAFVALVSLYATAAVFGFSAGLVNLLISDKAPGPLQAVFGILWGLTFLGYVAWMWPLAYLNHRFVAHFAGSREPSLLHLDLR